jgi:hypothetical protein
MMVMPRYFPLDVMFNSFPWMKFLQPYRFRIVAVKGKDNVAADYVIVKVRSVFGSGYSRDVVGRSGSANLKVGNAQIFSFRCYVQFLPMDEVR